MAVISLGRRLPAASSGPPGARTERATPCGSGVAPTPRRPCLALLPVGVAWPPGSPRTPVVSYTTFSPLPDRQIGRLASGVWGNRQGMPPPLPTDQFASLPPPTRRSVSVALSVGLPRLGVTQHRALRSPDFPHPAPCAERDRLADLGPLHLNTPSPACQGGISVFRRTALHLDFGQTERSRTSALPILLCGLFPFADAIYMGGL